MRWCPERGGWSFCRSITILLREELLQQYACPQDAGQGSTARAAPALRQAVRHAGGGPVGYGSGVSATPNSPQPLLPF